MKLASIRLEHFRAFEDETITFNDYTCLVGPNGGGKSTVLTALNIFFRYSPDSATNVTTLDADDFHHKKIDKPVSITVTFTNLSNEAQRDFANYYRNGKLTVTAEAAWNGNSAPIKHYGEREVMADFAEFFAAEGDGEKVEGLRKLYSDIRSSYADLPAPGTKTGMISALREYEERHPEGRVLRRSEDQFYGVSKGKNLLQKYVQWIFVPAVKDVGTEEFEKKTTALGLILERTVRAKLPFARVLDTLREEAIQGYQEILTTNASALTDLSASLQLRLREWAHPNTTLRLEWHSDPMKSVSFADPVARMITGEGKFEGPIAKFGHGLQRSLLLALLQELVTGDQSAVPQLILGCEEPELFQHPPQVRHFASVFQKLVSNGSQVIVCTHNPLFVKGEGFDDVRLSRIVEDPPRARVRQITIADLANRIERATGKKPKTPEGSFMKIAQVLQPSLNEMFFTHIAILVEGISDIAYITSYMTLTDRWDDFRRFGCHIVACGGKSSMVQPLAIAREMGIPVFAICDGDKHDCVSPDHRANHERDNKAILRLCGLNDAQPFPDQGIWETELVMWSEEIERAVIADLGREKWVALNQKVKTNHEITDLPGLDKNVNFIGLVLAQAWEDGCKIPSLERLCSSILDFAARHSKNLMPSAQHPAVAD
jgi:putative ATP-dependent endonuclease of OLD family